MSIAAVDDSPTIEFGEDPGPVLPSTGVTIEEGEDAEFVLTRTGLMDYEITVSVSIDDPGHFRRGDHGRKTPDRTVPVTFAAGEDTAHLTVHTSDDGRDIPDNTLTATVLPSQDNSYTPVAAGERRTSATVTVTDNDVAPEIRLSVSSSTVEEGQEAYFDIVRSVDSRNDVETPVLFGLRGEQRLYYYGVGPGENLARRFLRTEDDDYDDPDETVYEMTLVPVEGVPEDEQSQYRTIVGPSSITITVTDNDLPLVGVEQVEESYIEGYYGEFRIVRLGQTDSPLQVKARVTQTENSYFDRYDYLLNVDRTYTIDASEDSEVSSFQLQWEDGDEPEGSMTMQLVPGDGYRIDPERSIASFRVIDDDPAPTLAVTGATVSEDAGKIRFRVSLSSSVSPPSLQTVTVDYATEDGTAEAREDYTHIAGTLVFGPKKTSGVIDVPVLDNRLTEETESFFLVLSDPVNAELQDDQAKLTVVATITDNEPHVTVAPVAAEVDEGSPIRFRFTRSGDNIDLSGPLTVYFLAGYEDLPPEWLEVVIPADRSSVTWQKTTEDDDYDGPDLTFLAFVIPSTWRGLPLDYSSESGSVSVTVRDNDLPVVTIEAVHEGRTEGDSVEFTLAREGQIDQPLTVNVSVAQTSDSETDQADFIAGTPPSTATFAADSATATLTVRTSTDSVAEPHATITASITDEEDDGYRAGDPGSASVRIADDDRLQSTSLSLSIQSRVVEEGEDAVFVVRRTGGTNLDLVARVRVTEVKQDPNEPGFNRHNLQSVVTEREVAFSPGDETATLTVSTEDEDLNDGNSQIKASLLLSHLYRINPFPSIGNIWVRDNDIPTVYFEQAYLERVEDPDQLPRYTLVRTGDASFVLGVNLWRYVIRRYNKPFPDREEAFPAPRPFLAGDQDVTYTTYPGVVGPLGGEGRVYIETGYCEEVPGDCWYDSQYRVGEPSTFVATIHNDGQGVTVEADQASVDEGDAATFTLTRSGGTPNARLYALTVRLAATQNGQFIRGTAPQTITFDGYPLAATLTATMTIETLDDDVYESDGSITLTILPPAEGAPFGHFYEIVNSQGEATVAVVSDDDPAVSIADAEASEDGGSLTFTVDVPAVYEEVTVEWATSDGAGSEPATADQDYTTATGTLRFLEGETSKTISIEILDDGVHEPDETFTVTLRNPAGAALGRAAATGTIRDDDPEIPPVVTVWTNQGNVEEGEPANFYFRRQQPGGAESLPEGFGASPLTLNLTLTETGDFIEEALENYAGVRVNYTPGSSAATVTLPATHLYFFVQFSTEDDGQAEDNGSVKIELAEGPGYTIGEYSEATVNVRDNDLGISIADAVRHSEDATGMGFTITLSKASDQQVSVDVTTVDGTATSDAAVTATSLGRDFVAGSGSFTFAPGETEKVFTVTLVDDTFDEEEESFTVELSNPSGNVSLQDASATGAISDNDMTMIVGVYREAKTVNEDAEGQVEFRFELTAAEGSGTTASEKMSTVRWTVAEGTATAGEDYEAVKASVRTQIEPGVLSKKVGVTLLDDEVYEDEYETFTFDLKRAVRLEVDEDNRSIVVRLRDNETMRAAVAADSQNVAEGGTASFTVSLTPFENAVPVEIEYAVVGTAGPADYTAPSGNLTIRAGETSGRVTIPVLMDTLHDPDETLGILLTRVAGGGREIALLTDTLATVTILDAGSLSASLASGASAAEGDEIEFTIELPLPTDMPVLVEWATSDAQGEQAADSMGVDYTDASGTVTIPAGDTSGTFTVSTVEDSLVEGDETFTVVLRSARKGDDPATSTDVTMAIRSVTATILDDDTAPASITLTATPDRVDEDAGETDIAVTATLDGSTRLEDDVSVELSLKGSVAAHEDGSQPASVILTIPAGQASGTSTVAMTPANDEIAGGDKRVRIAGSASGFDVTQATVTITDDDEPPTGVTLTLSHTSVSEGAGTTTITVTGTLTGGDRRSEDTTIPMSVHGISLPAAEENGEPTIAATNDDYTAASVMLTIPAGGASGTATLEFTPTDDNLVEGDETVQVSGIFQELQVTPAVLTIEDDDREPDGIELSATPGSVTEGGGEVQVQVTATLTGGGTRMSDTAVTLSVYDVSAVAGADYTAASGILLIIPAGQVSGTASLSVTLVDDDIYEGTETLAIRGSNEDPGLSVRGVRISIDDDEEKPTEIRLVLDRDTIAEGGGSQQLRVTAIVQGDSKRAVSTRISLSFGAPATESSAGPSTPRSSTRSSTTRSSTRSSETGPSAVPPAAATDYSALVNTITIPAGESAGEVVVLVSPIDDPIAEGDESLEIRGSTPGLDVSSALVTITDNDVRGIVLSKTSLEVDEGDADGESYTVRLATQPTVEITVTVTGHDQTDLELTGLSPTNTLTFDATDWSVAQTVTVKAAQDTDAANDSITLTHTAAGGEYAGVNEDLPVTVDDDETVSIVLSKTSLEVDEGDADGGTYTVKLSHEPSEEVTVTVTGQDTTDLELTGLSATNTLTFDASDWGVAQTVTVKAAQDTDAANDSITLTHTAAGGEYEGAAEDLGVTVDDDETLGVVISPTAITVQAGGSNTYTVVLGSLPSGDVTVSLAGHEGAVLSLTGIDNDNALTFTQDNWNAPQTVSVSAAAAAQTSTITIGHSVTSADDPEYDGATAADVGVSVLEAPSTIQIQLGVTTSEQELEVPEGGANTYSMVLSHQPVGDVTVTVNNPTDNLDVTATPRSLTFTAENWDTPQEVTVTAVQDDDAANDSATVTHGINGGGYDGVTVPDVAVTVDDDETVSIVLSKTTLTVVEGDTTGGTYTVKLSHEPSEEVTVTVTGQDTTDLELTGLSATNTLTFDATDWGDAQTVTVKAAQDGDAANDSITLTHTAAGGEYAGVNEDLPVTVDDDETVSIVLSKTTLTVVEGAAAGGTYTVKLSHEPSEEVTVTVTGQDQTDLELTGLSATNTLTFDATSWSDAQTVTVKAAQDGDAANDSITLTHTAAGGEYAGVNEDLPVTVDDDETVSIVLSETTLTVVEGAAAGGTYTVKLSHEPSEEVTVTVTGQDTTDLELTGLSATNTLTFDATDWGDAQTVTVKAAQDGDAANDSITLTHTAAGGEYEGVAEDLPVTVDDDETVSIVLSETTLTVIEGDAAGQTYTVKLSHEPSEEVTVTVTGHDTTDLELTGLGEGDTLSFTTSNWSDAQTVTVKAAQDTDAANDKVTLTHTAAGGEYEGVAEDLPVTVDDDETVSIVLSETTLTVIEGDADGQTYTVKLSHEPSEEVTVTVTGHDTTDLELTGLSPTNTLTFDATDWGDAQTVTVKAAQDDDGADDPVTLTHTAAGGEYEGATEDLGVTVDDDENINQEPLFESVQVRFNTAAHAILEGDTTTVVVSLTEALVQDVTIPLTRTNQAGAGDADYSGVPASLTFDSGDTEQSFTFSATVDSEDEDEEQVVLGFETLPEGVGQGTVSQTTITILDVPSVSFGASDYSATEGGEDAVVTVQLSEALAADLTVPLTAEGDGGATPEDWSGVPEEVTFSAGETSKTFTVVAFDDSVEDDDEMVNLGFGILPAGLNAGSPASATITLMNVEEPSSDPCEHVWCAATAVLKWAAGYPTIEPVPLLSCASTCPGSSITGGRFMADGVEYRIASVAAIRDIRPTNHNLSKFRFAISARDTVTGNIISPTERQIRSWTLYINDDIQLPLSSAAQRIGAADFVWFGETFYHFVEDTILEMHIETSDDDTVSIVLSSTTPVDEGDSNYGGTYTVKLSHQPSEEVTVTVSGQDGTDLTLTGLSSANTLTFTTENWNTAQTVTVKAGDDGDAADDVVTLTHTASGGEYAGVSADLAVTVYDDDKAFLVLGEPSLAVDEGDAAGQTYTVQLSDEPSEDVTVTVSGHEGSDLTLTGLSATNELTFTTENWDTAQTVTVTAGQDSDAADDVVTLTHTASGGEYAGVMSDMAVRVDDDEDVGNAPEEVGNAPVENTAATGRPTIGGTPAVGETLTAETSDIEEVNGLTNASFAFQWARNDGSVSAHIDGATGATYTVTEADVGYEIEVRVSFTDDAGFEEMLTSDSVYVQPPSPLYGGFDSTTLPSEHDGSNTFTFEIHFSEEPVLGFEAVRDYVLDVTNGDVTSVRRTTQGSNIRWEITVQPDGNDEVTLVLPITTDCDDQGAVCTSSEKMLSNKSSVTIAGPPETARQVQPENSPATSAPTIGGTAQVGETLTADTSGIADADGLDNAIFAYQWMADDSDIAGATDSTYTLDASDEGKTIKVRASFTDDNSNDESRTSAATAAVAAAPPTNNEATGAPTISGTVKVGHVLTADTTGIADPDGLDNAAFAYQWMADDLAIAGATGSTYTLADDDEGRSVKVRITFTDDADNEESLTSAATAVVAAAPEEQIAPLTASVSQVPDFHDGSAAFTFELRFSEEPADGFSYRTLRDHAFTVTGGEVTKARRLEAGKNIRWEITVQPSGNGDVTVVLPATTDCDAEGAICTEDGRMLAVSVELSVNGP